MYTRHVNYHTDRTCSPIQTYTSLSMMFLQNICLILYSAHISVLMFMPYGGCEGSLVRRSLDVGRDVLDSRQTGWGRVWQILPG